MSDIKMNFGEDLELDSNQVVIGADTGRVVAKFSHHCEAQSFVNFYNKQQEQQAEITRLNKVIKQLDIEFDQRDDIRLEQLAELQKQNDVMREALEVVYDQLIKDKAFTQEMHFRPYWRYSVNEALATVKGE